MKSASTVIRNQNIKSAREEIIRRLTERGFKIIPKTNKKFWAVKSITKKEIKQIVKEVTTLLEYVGLDGPVAGPMPVLTFSYALLSETKTGAAGISIEM